MAFETGYVEIIVLMNPMSHCIRISLAIDADPVDELTKLLGLLFL